MKNTAKCSKCGGEMLEGFTIEGEESARSVPCWISGKPEASFMGGLKIKGRERHKIQVFRCAQCGYLESYAPSTAIPPA
jgi:predicted nucleic-acid-binding Zn-ribbon protein